MMEDIKLSDEEIERLILNALYEVRGDKPINDSKIRRILSVALDRRLLEYHLKNLAEKRLLRTKKGPSSRLNGVTYPGTVYYEISTNGLEYVESGFSKPVKKEPPVFIGTQYYIGSLINVNISIEQILDETSLSEFIRQEVKEYFDQLQSEINKEEITKDKVKELFKNIASKGVTQLTDAAIGLIVKQMLGV